MNEDKFNQLIQELLDQTKAGKVRWEETAEKNTLRIIVGEHMIRLAKEVDASRMAFYSIVLLDRQGRTIIDGLYILDDKQIELLRELHTYAWRSMEKTKEKAIDSVLAALKSGNDSR
jgi:hypothetical protein